MEHQPTDVSDMSDSHDEAAEDEAPEEEDYDDDDDDEEQDLDDVDSDSAASTSSESSSSTTTTTGSGATTSATSRDNEQELAKILPHSEALSIPCGLGEHPGVFQQFFSLDTWNALTPQQRAHLQQFLPRFDDGLLTTDEAADVLSDSVQQFFAGDLQRFGVAPLLRFQRNLEVGNYRPDVQVLRKSIEKSKRREQNFREYERLSQLAKQLFIARETLLRRAYKQSPDTQLRAVRQLRRQQSSMLYGDTKLSAVRARKRYYKELLQISQTTGVRQLGNLSADEECDETDALTAEEWRHEAQLQQNISDEISTMKLGGTAVVGGSGGLITASDKCIYNTTFKRRPDLTDEEALRAQQYARKSRLSNRNLKPYLLNHKRRRLLEPTAPDFETSDIRLRDVCARAQIGGNFKRASSSGKQPGRKPKQPKAIVNNVHSSSEPPALVPFQTDTNSQRQPNKHLLLQEKAVSRVATTPPPALTPHQQQQQQPPALHLFSEPVEQTQYLPPPLTTNGKRVEAVNCYAGNFNEASPYLHGESETFGGILDNDVELQQVEVETYGEETVNSQSPTELTATSSTSTSSTTPTSTATMLPFVISNEIELPQSAELPEKVFQTPQKDRKRRQSKEDDAKANARTCRQNLNMLNNLPKLEPIPNVMLKLPMTPPKDRSPTITTTTTSNAVKKPSLSSFSNKLNVSAATTPASESTAAEMLLQDTHECFFSLMRELFCATPQYRLTYTELSTKIEQWLRNPITALNNWYSLVDNWSAELKSALKFLTGDLPQLPDDYVPYVEYKQQLDIYQWIGAGRDFDGHLKQLFDFWLQQRNAPSVRQANNEDVSHNNNNNNQQYQQEQPMFEQQQPQTQQQQQQHAIPDLVTIYEQHEESSPTTTTTGGVAVVHSQPEHQLPSIPPSRCPTNWKVKPATVEEIHEFQRQERERFEQPHKAYTYRMHGYESVVGPVKGIYNQVPLALTKAREHIMMIGDRPNYVTILTLVRDATARLPNGEGTRADISELLKCSQYISRDAAETVLQTIVSGALDRMHTEQDPCIHYDPRRKIWIYLHRHRSVEEFERMHQQCQNQVPSKTKKPTQRKPKVKATGKSTIGENEMMSGHMMTMATPQQSPQPPTTTTTATLTLPALVPSSPSISQVPNGAINISQQQQQPVKLVSTQKSLPVPPLKYNIPTSQHHHHHQQQQQQKSLLKAAYNTQRDTKFVTTPGAHNNPKQFPSKTMPVVVATPSGLQTVHVSSAVSPVQSSGSLTTTTTTTPAPALSATLGGKRVALHKPIIINQITQQLSSKTKNQFKQQHQQQQQQQQQNLLIPMASEAPKSTPSANEAIQTIFLDNNQQQQQKQKQQQSFKNIIRLVPAVGAAGGVRSQPPQQQQQQQQMQMLQQQAGISIVSPSHQVSPNANAASTAAGTIVKMTPQAFASLQQKPGGQHIFLKQANTPTTQQRVIVGNLAQGASQTTKTTTTDKSPQQQKTIQLGSHSSSITTTTTNTSATTTTQKPLTVMVSQSQAMTKVIKAATATAKLQHQQQQQQQQQQPHQQQLRNTTTGQIITLRGDGSPLADNNTKKSSYIQLAPTSIAGGAQQFAVVSQSRNIISLAGGQQRLITTQAGAGGIGGNNKQIATTTSSTTTTLTKEKNATGATKVFGKGNILVAQPGSTMFANLGGNLRVINASAVNTSGTTTTTSTAGGGTPHTTTTYNLANLQGKQVVFATKATNSPQTIGGGAGGGLKNVVNVSASQVQQLQNAGLIIGGQTLKLHSGNQQIHQLTKATGNMVNTLQAGSTNSTTTQQLQTVILGNQVLRVQQMPQGLKTVAAVNRNVSAASSLSTSLTNTTTTNSGFVVANSGGGCGSNDNNGAPTLQKTFLLGGQTLRLQTQEQLKAANSGNAGGRLVLAMPGGGGQVFLSPSLQGGNATINLKSLQNMKVVSLANLQAQQQQQLKSNLATTTGATTKLTEFKDSKSGGDVVS